MPVDFPLKPQHPQNMSPDIIRCPLRDDIPHLGNRWFACEQECHISNSWVLLLPGKGCGPCCCHTACLLQMAWQRGSVFAQGGPGDLCLLRFPHSPSPALSSMPAHPACKFPPFTPFLASGLSVSCSLHSWPALGEGQIFTAPRLTEDRTGAQ